MKHRTKQTIAQISLPFFTSLFLLASALPLFAQDEASDQILGEWEVMEVIADEQEGYGPENTVGFCMRFTEENEYSFYPKGAYGHEPPPRGGPLPTMRFELNMNAMPPQLDLIMEQFAGPNSPPVQSIQPCIFEIDTEGMLVVVMGTTHNQLRPASFEPDDRFPIFKMRRVEEEGAE